MKKSSSVILSIIMIMTTIFLANFSSQAAPAKPNETTISSVSAKVNGFTVKWKKQTQQTTGYQIQYSTSSEFENAKTVTISNNETTSKSITKLKAKKKYYIRVRTYKTQKDGEKSKKVYSSWSESKSVTTKSNSSSPKKGTTVYITPTGKKYHYSKCCAGENAIKRELNTVKGSYDPCKICAQ